MLTVIVDTRAAPERAPYLLAQLTAGAVEGLVRQVLLVGVREGMVGAFCEETGADSVGSFEEAVAEARQPFILAAHPQFRFREGWIEAVNGFVGGHGKAALVRGQGAGLLGGPYAVLVERGRADQARDVRALRRRLGLLPTRIG